MRRSWNFSANTGNPGTGKPALIPRNSILLFPQPSALLFYLTNDTFPSKWILICLCGFLYLLSSIHSS